MRSVGLKVLKNRLSEYVRLAASGERVLVTDRDRVVAELVPPAEGRTRMVSDVLLAEAVRRGQITPPTLPRGTPPRKPAAPWADIRRGLKSDRDDR
jgi:antitoxin (DNA-binding transcriptional repressor) of toxin-antitoxin stability system